MNDDTLNDEERELESQGYVCINDWMEDDDTYVATSDD